MHGQQNVKKEKKNSVSEIVLIYIYSGFRGGDQGGDPTVLGLLQTARYSDGLDFWNRPNKGQSPPENTDEWSLKRCVFDKSRVQTTDKTLVKFTTAKAN
jgi:hypothetical protein